MTTRTSPIQCSSSKQSATWYPNAAGIRTRLIILGGAGYSIFPQSALDYLGADMGIRGEGEAAFVALLDCIQKSADVYGLPGVYLRGRKFSGKAESISDLNDLPLPDPRIAALCTPEAGEIWMPFQTRRGCPLRCSYCSTPFIEGCRLRKRRLEAVIKSLADHIDAGFRKFWFVDNTFNLPLGYSRELCRAIIESGLKMEWRCIIHPSHMDEGTCRSSGQGKLRRGRSWF